MEAVPCEVGSLAWRLCYIVYAGVFAGVPLCAHVIWVEIIQETAALETF